MTRINAALSLALAAALAAAVAGGAEAAVPPDLARAVRDYDRAQVAGDRAELERLLADDYRLVNSAGEVETKAQLIADFTAPAYRLDPFVVREPIETAWRDGAVMGGLVRATGVDGGKRFDVVFRFADVWARRNGVWRVVYTGVTRPK
ncbi:DUF4440 domain-containing protein [Caulobacter sp. CCUG 60055]|uniref:nuclear transport factor 2 family protein n=1 Tax=Caulobacter sp. CCUG 60055 TaxID=2100090 RepID=UPI001FA80122|nr:nuclear transport factor 2 family protein [Caulobacter sp. CCUG 60055]MCI3181340.1 DUF4440 domain-containing protein [Caulobacter sp. CCUG 60055]